MALKVGLQQGFANGEIGLQGSNFELQMSALGQTSVQCPLYPRKRTSTERVAKSAFVPKADMGTDELTLSGN